MRAGIFKYHDDVTFELTRMRNQVDELELMERNLSTAARAARETEEALAGRRSQTKHQMLWGVFQVLDVTGEDVRTAWHIGAKASQADVNIAMVDGLDAWEEGMD